MSGLSNLTSLVFAIMFYSSIAVGSLKTGDLIIKCRISIRNGGISLSAQKMTYYSDWIDDSYRRNKKTEWKLVLRERKNKIIDSTYLVFDMNENPPHGSGVNNGTSKQPQEMKAAPPPWEPYESAWINFKYQKNAYKVELLKNGKVLATTLVDMGNH
jgi:hypothetical protein